MQDLVTNSIYEFKYNPDKEITFSSYYIIKMYFNAVVLDGQKKEKFNSGEN